MHYTSFLITEKKQAPHCESPLGLGKFLPDLAYVGGIANETILFMCLWVIGSTKCREWFPSLISTMKKSRLNYMF